MARLSLLASFVAAAGLVAADGIYSSSSPVLQVNHKNYDSLIAQSNHTSNLKPAYEKAAKSLVGLAKVAAINCDEEPNKPLCAKFGVQGFPTLKIVKPGKKVGKPVVEDYQGQRSAKAIVEAVTDKIPNHVKRLQDSGLEEWVQDTGAKAILFSEKGITAALVKALAVDFLGSIKFAHIRHKEEKAVEKYGITKFPSIVLLPGEGAEPTVYSGEMKKEALTEFLSQVAAPNPDPAPKKGKASSTSKKPRASASSAFSKASEAHKSSDFEDYIDQTVILDDDTPTESPLPIVEQEKPMVVPDVAPPIPTLATAPELASACLTPKSGNCVLVLLPKKDEEASSFPETAIQALAGFAEIADKHHKRQANIFPFYAIPSENENAALIRQSLSLKPETELEVIVVNMKRSRWRSYSADDFSARSVEGFVDAIRFGEGKNQKLPSDFFSEPSEVTAQDAESSAPETATNTASSIHDEL